MAGGDRKQADSWLVAALAGGASVQDAASTARVSEATVYRRLREPEFTQRVDEARAELLGQAMARLSAAATAAVTTLVLLLKADAPPAVRLGAARAILDATLRWHESEALARRLDNVEAWIKALDAESEAGKVGPWQRQA